MTLAFKPCGIDAVGITVRAGVALIRAIERVSGLSAKIKWVNDIVVGRRKLAGILAEGDFAPDGTLTYCALGIGVNLKHREFPSDLRDIVTTLEDETGSVIDPTALRCEFVREFFSLSDYSRVIALYREYSAVIGERVEVRRISGEVFFGQVLDVSDSGGLVVRLDNGEWEELISAEVSIVRT